MTQVPLDHGRSKQGFGDSVSGPPAFIWRFANAVFDESHWQLKVGDKVAELEPRPLEVLLHLLRHAGEVVAKEQLLESLYGHTHVGDGALTNAIGKLRKALGDNEQELIVTVHRVGYRFAAPVRKSEVGRLVLQHTSLKLGDTIPRREHWKLLCLLGSNDGVEVWLARHLKTHEERVFKFSLGSHRLADLQRRVTLFRVLNGALGNRDDINRLLDWDLEEAPYFIECEYGGCDLHAWAMSMGGFGEISLKVRLSLFIEIAEAVAAAHSAGVLHNDLKPANVLIYQDKNGIWHPRITDFGSGSLLDPDLPAKLGVTQLGFARGAVGSSDARGGTLLYAAPELIDGQVTTAKSDIYSLGVMLYQMVVGDLRRPLSPGWDRSISDEVLRQDIADSADLNPARRIKSAAELVRRLRSLEERRGALTALRAGQAEALRLARALELAGIQRRWQLTAALLLLTGLLSTGSLLWTESTARARAEASEASTKAVDLFLRDDLLGGEDPYTAGLGPDTKIGDLIRKASAHLDADLSDQPEVYSQLSLTIGVSLFNLGLENQSRERLVKALKYAQSRVGVDAPVTLDIQQQLGQLAADQGRPEESEALFMDNQKKGRSRLGETNPVTFDARAGVARARSEEGHFGEAAQLYQTLIADMRRAGVGKAEIADKQWYLADIDIELHQWRQAESFIDEAEREFRREYGAEHPLTLWAEISKGRLLLAQGRMLEAEALLKGVRASSDKALSPEHEIGMYGLNYLAEILLSEHRTTEALPVLQEAGRKESLLDDEGHYLVRATQHWLAEAQLQLGHVSDARQIAQRAFVVATAVVGPENPDTIDAERLLADVEFAAGDLASAGNHYRHALEFGARRMPFDNLRLAQAHFGLGRLLAVQGESVEAEGELDIAYEMFKSSYGDAQGDTEAAYIALLNNRQAADRLCALEQLDAWNPERAWKPFDYL